MGLVLSFYPLDDALRLQRAPNSTRSPVDSHIADPFCVSLSFM